jgi:hypothetical protein
MAARTELTASRSWSQPPGEKGLNKPAPQRPRSKSQPRVRNSEEKEMRGRGRSSLGAVETRRVTQRSCSKTPRGSRLPFRSDAQGARLDIGVAVERVYTYCVPELLLSAAASSIRGAPVTVQESRRTSRDAANLRGKRRALHQILGSISQSRASSEGQQEARPSPEHGSSGMPPRMHAPTPECTGARQIDAMLSTVKSDIPGNSNWERDLRWRCISV